MTLLGYVLDPARPDASDFEVLASLPSDAAGAGELLDRTASWGGRWILIAEGPQSAFLFSDPTGQRQVCYTLPAETGDLWCASDPQILADQLALRPSDGALRYMSSPAYRGNREAWWPGNRTPFAEIRHLLPNHVLDLHSGRVLRAWPVHDLERLSLEEGVARAGPLLRGQVAAAHARFRLAVSLSAGWDSRLLLAATKEVRANLRYFSYVVWDMTAASPDVRVPARLLATLGLDHDVIHCPPRMDPRLREVFARSVATPHEAYGFIVQGFYDQHTDDCVVAKGNASEIARRYYYSQRRLHPPRRELTAEWLARRSGLGAHPFVVEAFGEWLAEAGGVSAVRLLDLFYWEQRIGNWQAMAQQERDIVQEAFSPYNCRSLLVTLLSVDERYRTAPRHTLYREIIASLWPEVLSQPLNPHKRLRPGRVVIKSVRELLRRVSPSRI